MSQILQNLLDDFIGVAGRSPGAVRMPVTPQRMSFRRHALSRGAMDGFSEFLPSCFPPQVCSEVSKQHSLIYL